ncbi:MAG: o-succinylbenzoate--CoA ligase [Cellulomonas sp.]|nr:o-succinylbenzoate--CoA ligase [Cellulomonas sp.]MCR6648397.1 o-succinylbenzoate--CoA ligase [Cellulomonas sp.]
MTRPLHDVAARADLLLDLLGAALDGTGPALRVVPGTPTPPAGGPAGTPTGEVADDVALVVATSGSTGEPREALLTATALRASGRATERRTSGPGRWLLALPVDHVAGLQVLVRSVLAGTRPVAVPDGPFTPEAFTAGVGALDDADPAAPVDVPRYTSLVPTQLVRLLDDATATAAARTFDAILLGGAAAPAALLARAREAGLRVVTTYGMTETCGGCVYDGEPLDGVRVLLDDDGRVLLGGDVLTAGYRDRPDLDATTFVERDGTRFLRTSDLGRLDDGRLTVLGRADDVVVTGGVNVAPAAVEAALVTLPGIADALVVGVPDDEWGQCVACLVVLDPGAPAPALDDVRAHVTRTLGAPHAPRHLIVVDALPLRGPGKPDRRTARALVEARLHPTSPGSAA